MMVKKVYIAVLILTVGLLSALEGPTVFDEKAYPPNGWTQSMEKAIERAAAEDKMILINFTGSDWCSWCQKLETSVFSQSDFLEWADENLVLVFLDYPNSLVQENNIIQQNQILQQVFSVRGYPTIVLLDSDMTPLKVTGYLEGNAQVYINHLQNDWLELGDDVEAGFKRDFQNVVDENLIPLGIE